MRIKWARELLKQRSIPARTSSFFNLFINPLEPLFGTRPYLQSNCLRLPTGRKNPSDSEIRIKSPKSPTPKTTLLPSSPTSQPQSRLPISTNPPPLPPPKPKPQDSPRRLWLTPSRVVFCQYYSTGYETEISLRQCESPIFSGSNTIYFHLTIPPSINTKEKAYKTHV